jgi:hypothetical protein
MSPLDLRICKAIGSAVVGLLIVGAAPAAAGEFEFRGCAAAPDFSTRAFGLDVTSGMSVKRTCDPEGPGVRGLITANVVRRAPVMMGARAVVKLDAPPGTQFSRLRWSGTARRVDCRYALQLYALGPGRTVSIKNVRANHSCPKRNRAQAAGWVSARSFDIAGTTQIIQRVVCVAGKKGSRACSTRARNYIRTFKAAVTVVDVSPPEVQITGGALPTGRWVGGEQDVQYTASDNVGIQFADAIAAGAPRSRHERACDYTVPLPCSNGPGGMVLDTTKLPEGSQGLYIAAYDAAGNVGASLMHTARIDNTAPAHVPVGVLEGEGWRREPVSTLTWANPEEVDRAPIRAAHYKLCRAGGTDCRTDRIPGGGIDRIGVTAPEPGTWTAAVWREDEAGNQHPDNASAPVTLRYDPEPPELAFQSFSPADPTRVVVKASDRVSDVAGGTIEISRYGTGAWQTLNTVREPVGFAARIDDSQLPAGTYVLRARASDLASNEASTDRYADGRPVVLQLPVRLVSGMRGGIIKRKLVRRKVRRHGKVRVIRRRVTVLDGSARVPLGGRVRIDGALTTRDGRGIVGAQVRVYSRTRTSAERMEGVITTGANGRYQYTAGGSASRILRFVHAGSATILPSQHEVSLLVPGSTGLQASRRRVVNGQAVVFRGRVGSLPLPPGGKLIEMQVKLSGKYQTFRTTRSAEDGRWEISYRFRRSCGVLRYRFRARAPRESGTPFEAGQSRPIVVKVRGRPCPV